MDIPFTNNEIIDNIEMDDPMVDMIGYIDLVKGSEIARNNARVARFILNNTTGRRVQIIAWEKYITELERVAILNNIVQVEGARSNYVRSNSKYNDGNVNFQLNVNDHTTLNSLGIYNQPIVSNPITDVDFDTIAGVKGIIRIKGFIKNNIRSLQTKYVIIGLGSITDGEKKLEIHVSQFDNSHNIHKGHEVSVIGELCHRANSPPYLSVKNIKDVAIITTTNKPSFKFLLQGNKYVQLQNT